MCRHRVFRRLVINRGPENKGVAIAFTKKYGIKQVQILAYNLKANGIIERGYRSISKALTRISRGTRRQRKHLLAVLLAERTSIYRPTRVTPFSLIYKREVILPVKTRYLVQRLLDQ